MVAYDEEREKKWAEQKRKIAEWEAKIPATEANREKADNGTGLLGTQIATGILGAVTATNPLSVVYNAATGFERGKENYETIKDVAGFFNRIAYSPSVHGPAPDADPHSPTYAQDKKEASVKGYFDSNMPWHR